MDSFILEVGELAKQFTELYIAHGGVFSIRSGFKIEDESFENFPEVVMDVDLLKKNFPNYRTTAALSDTWHTIYADYDGVRYAAMEEVISPDRRERENDKRTES